MTLHFSPNPEQDINNSTLDNTSIEGIGYDVKKSWDKTKVMGLSQWHKGQILQCSLKESKEFGL